MSIRRRLVIFTAAIKPSARIDTQEFIRQSMQRVNQLRNYQPAGEKLYYTVEHDGTPLTEFKSRRIQKFAALTTARRNAIKYAYGKPWKIIEWRPGQPAKVVATSPAK